MREGTGVYRVFVGGHEGNRPVGRPRRRWEDNIKLDLMEIGIDGANGIQLARYRFKWRDFVNTVMNLRVLKESRVFFLISLVAISFTNILHHSVK
jgi:hypothetical protein